MKKSIFTLVLFALLGTVSFGQDLIIMSSGDTVLAKVEEITEESVKYKKQENPTGPSYSISLSKVCKIVFQNGTVEEYCVPGEKRKNTKTAKKKNDASKLEWTRHQVFVAPTYVLPLGEFSTNAVGDTLPMAENGMGFQVGYRFFAKPWLGWDVSYGMAFLNSIENTDELQGQLGGLGGTVNIKEGNWTLSQITTGPVFNYEISKRWQVSGSAKVGMLLTTAPDLSFDGSVNIVIINVVFSGDRKIENGSSLLYGGDLRFTYRLNQGFGLYVFGDYINSSATQTSTFNLTTSVSGTNTTETTANFNYQYINTGLGLVFTF